MAVDYLHPRPVYRLECVATHGVHVSIAGIFPPGRPFFLLPALSVIGTLFTMCSSSLLIICPYHMSRFSVIFVDACVTLLFPLIYLFLVFVIPHILFNFRTRIHIYILYTVNVLCC